jgi:hypothetical protein
MLEFPGLGASSFFRFYLALALSLYLTVTTAFSARTVGAILPAGTHVSASARCRLTLATPRGTPRCTPFPVPPFPSTRFIRQAISAHPRRAFLSRRTRDLLFCIVAAVPPFMHTIL